MDWNGTKATSDKRERTALPAVALPSTKKPQNVNSEVNNSKIQFCVIFLTGPIHFSQEEVTSQRLALRFYRFSAS